MTIWDIKNETGFACVFLFNLTKQGVCVCVAAIGIQVSTTTQRERETAKGRGWYNVKNHWKK